MTSEEIKSNLSMQDVLYKYGIKVHRSGMASCPFHSDKHPSMKVFKDGYKCFSCNRDGDIFKFVMEYENVSFSEAFKILGGSYEKRSPAEHSKFMEEKRKREAERKSEKDFIDTINKTLTGLRTAVKIYEPFSDKWVEAINNLTYIEGMYETIFILREEVNKLDVYRKCKRINNGLGIG